MRKLLYIVPLAVLMLTVTVTTIQGPKAAAQDECEYSEAPNIGEGWTLKNCGGEISYINPSGEECFANSAEVDVVSCGNEVNNPNRIQVD
jgi:hypothetical protein